MFCDDLEGWDGGGNWEGNSREGDVCLLKADSHFVQQKLIQHCKAIIFQFKINLKKPIKKNLTYILGEMGNY